MKNPKQKYRKALLFSGNQVLFLKNWKLWRVSTTIVLNIFCWNFAHVSYWPMSSKGCLGFFNLFRSWVICKNKRRSGFYTFTETSFFTFLWITQDLSRIKRIPNSLLSRIRVQNFSTKLYGSWSSSKFSNFQTNNPAFER